jgi:hypothetical protein
MTLEQDFRHDQTDIKIVNTFSLIGLVASLLLAFPMMIGYVGPAGLGGGYVFIPVPLVACFTLAKLIVWLRR